MRAFTIFGETPELPWTYALAVELAKHGPTSVIRLGVAVPLVGHAPPWPSDERVGDLRRESWTFPPGFHRKFSFLFAPLIRWRLKRSVRHIEKQHGVCPHVIVFGSQLERYTRDLADDRLAYLSYDDFSTTGAAGSRQGEPAERALIERAGTVLCSSRYLCDSFRERFPGKKEAIWHLPHGVDASSVNHAPDDSPVKDTVCVVGALTGRYDWELIDEVVARLPSVEFSFCGEIGPHDLGDEKEGWRARMAGVLQRPNVRHARIVGFENTAPVFWSSAANWMPYDAELPFVRACSPLKLTNGIASGRAVISADVPESRLYPEWVSIYRNADEAVALFSKLLGDTDDEENRQRRRAQVAFARDNTWTARAQQVVDILERL